MEPLLLLHGAMGSRVQLQPLVEMLSGNYNVYSMDFAGHGGREVPEVLSISAFANEVIEWLKENGLQKINLFGYSMGGYVALYLAKHYPEVVESVTTFATKLHWDKETAAKEVAMLQPEVIERKVPKFAAELQERHNRSDWKLLMKRTGEMIKTMGDSNPLQSDDYKQLQCPVLLMLGDRDKMVTLDETVEVYRNIPDAQLAVLPGTRHAIEQADYKMVGFFIRNFIASHTFRQS
jgi:pimeloyl-ACP methyl ester carboxylesterase